MTPDRRLIGMSPLLVSCWRSLVRRPAFAGATVITLGLGLGAAVTVFAVVHAVLLRPLPFPDADVVVRVEERHAAGRALNLTGATLRDVAESSRSFRALGAWRSFPFNLSGIAAAEPVTATRVSEGFFDVLAARARQGRLFVPDDFEPGAGRVAVIDEGLWRRALGGDPGAIGRTVRLDGEEHVIVGVLPTRLRFPADADVWLPLDAERLIPSNRRSHLFAVIGRLRPDTTLGAARAELHAIATAIGAADPSEHPLSLAVTPLGERIAAPVRPALLVASAAAALLLLVACANVAGLLVVRGVERRRELAIRGALGASPLTVLRQLALESLALGLGGTAAGLALAATAIRLLPAALPDVVPRTGEIRVDGVTLLFAIGAGLATAIVAGSWPARLAGRVDLRDALAGSHASGSREGRHLGRVLVVAQIGLLVVLLGGACLLVRSLLVVGNVPLGFEPGGVLAFHVSPAYPSTPRQAAFADDVLAGLAARSGVERAAVASALPTGALPATSFAVEGRDPDDEDQQVMADVLAVSPAYFELLHIPRRTGRVLDDGDAAGAPVVVVLSRTAAEAFWPGQDPLGRGVTLLHWNEPLPARVVGVVEDVRQRGPDAPVEPAVYFSHRQFADRVLGFWFLARTAGDPRALAPVLRQVVRRVDPDQPPSALRPLDDVLRGAVAPRRFNALLVGAFAAVALALVGVGLYGLLARTVEQRRREVAIRMALGERTEQARRRVLGEAAALGAAGLLIGAPLAVLAGRGAAALLYGVEPTDPASLLAVVATVAIVSLVAAWLPARRIVDETRSLLADGSRG